MKSITLIIAEHNEGTQLNDTLDSILSTSNHELYDIVVVSDGSTVPLNLEKYKDLIKHVKTKERGGVGAAFDAGFSAVTTPNVIVMGSDIRFLENGYVEKMLDALENHRKSWVSTVNIGINAERMDIHHPKSIRRYGARTLFFLKAEDLPKNTRLFKPGDPRLPNYRNILEAKWISRQEGNLYEIPCVLGAFYGISSEWYAHTKGFWGHRYWGTLEPYISLKSWLAGGDCLQSTEIEVAHIFKQHPSHVTHVHDLMYNKLFIAEALFPPRIARIFVDFLGMNEHINRAKRMVAENQKKLKEVKEYHKSIFVNDLHWYYEKFPYKYYDLIQDIK